MKFTKRGRHRRASRRRVGRKTTPVKVVTFRRAAAKKLRIGDLRDLIKLMNLRISLSRPTREASLREVNGGFLDLPLPEVLMAIFGASMAENRNVEPDEVCREKCSHA